LQLGAAIIFIEEQERSRRSSSTRSGSSPSMLEMPTPLPSHHTPLREESVVLTTNLAFRDWSTIFLSVTSATALIDRVVHHADVIAIEGDSYCAREADAQAKPRCTRKKPAPETEPLDPNPPT
jgi:hypothetical protein